ncbi:hypothetical protein Tco_1016383 [Tanacetum coccineum]|uniref:Uncharacterized protein n=1 Tax=Tanacetum coccineum TaxID=301880 RepID=A0ABQ5FNI2_9ASTR
MKYATLRLSVLDSFELESNSLGISNDPYARDLGEYKSESENKITEFEEEEQWECGVDKTYYDPPELSMENFEVKRYSFENGKSFVCVTKILNDDTRLERVNGSRFKKMIRKEMDTAQSVQRTM